MQKDKRDAWKRTGARQGCRVGGGGELQGPGDRRGTGRGGGMAPVSSLRGEDQVLRGQRVTLAEPQMSKRCRDI